MQPDRTNTVSRARASVDAGLRNHLSSVYNRMTLGVMITAVTAWLVANTPPLLALFMGGPQMYLVIFAPLAIVWFGFNPMTMSSRKLMVSFIAISVLYGISFSVIALAFAGADIARAFFIAAGMFAGLSIYGYVTKKNLDGLGAFAVMGVIGLLVASVVFMIAAAMGYHNPMISNVIAGIGILVFSALTAWQTQTMKEMYHPAAGEEANSRMAWSAALTLYISFIALFQYILQFVSQR